MIAMDYYFYIKYILMCFHVLEFNEIQILFPH